MCQRLSFISTGIINLSLGKELIDYTLTRINSLDKALELNKSISEEKKFRLRDGLKELSDTLILSNAINISQKVLKFVPKEQDGEYYKLAEDLNKLLTERPIDINAYNVKLKELKGKVEVLKVGLTEDDYKNVLIDAIDKLNNVTDAGMLSNIYERLLADVSYKQESDGKRVLNLRGATINISNILAHPDSILRENLIEDISRFSTSTHVTTTSFSSTTDYIVKSSSFIANIGARKVPAVFSSQQRFNSSLNPQREALQRDSIEIKQYRDTTLKYISELTSEGDKRTVALEYIRNMKRLLSKYEILAFDPRNNNIKEALNNLAIEININMVKTLIKDYPELYPPKGIKGISDSYKLAVSTIRRDTTKLINSNLKVNTDGMKKVDINSSLVIDGLELEYDDFRKIIDESSSTLGINEYNARSLYKYFLFKSSRPSKEDIEILNKIRKGFVLRKLYNIRNSKDINSFLEETKQKDYLSTVKNPEVMPRFDTTTLKVPEGLLANLRYNIGLIKTQGNTIPNASVKVDAYLSALNVRLQRLLLIQRKNKSLRSLGEAKELEFYKPLFKNVYAEVTTYDRDLRRRENYASLLNSYQALYSI